MQTVRNKNLLTVQITGLVNAETYFPILALEGIDILVFDFDKLDGFNSLGVKGWINYLKPIKPEIKIIFKNCKRVVVDQMNMVADFLPKGAEVESFYVPHHCPKCQKFINVLFESGKHYLNKQITKFPQVMCDKCNVSAEIDVLVAKYFLFLNKKS